MFYSSKPRKSLSFPSTGVSSFTIIHSPCQLCSVPPNPGSPYLSHQQESLLSLSSTHPASCVLFLQTKKVLIFPIHRSPFFPYHTLTLQAVFYFSKPRKFLLFLILRSLFFQPYFPVDKMNFSQAVRGQLKPSHAILAINSQAETELRRSLSKDEETFLLRKFNPHILLEQIQKVIQLCYNVHSV